MKKSKLSPYRLRPGFRSNVLFFEIEGGDRTRRSIALVKWAIGNTPQRWRALIFGVFFEGVTAASLAYEYGVTPSWANGRAWMQFYRLRHRRDAPPEFRSGEYRDAKFALQRLYSSLPKKERERLKKSIPPPERKR